MLFIILANIFTIKIYTLYSPNSRVPFGHTLQFVFCMKSVDLPTLFVNLSPELWKKKKKLQNYKIKSICHDLTSESKVTVFKQVQETIL